MAIHNWCGEKTDSIDGTGIKPSVDGEISQSILSYLKVILPPKAKIADLGAGVGHLQRAIDMDGEFSALSFEGYSNLPFVCDRERINISDISKPLDSSLYGSFNITTSFECIEHIPQKEQGGFWENAKKLAPQMLCSIHCMNEENEYHTFIRSPEWWQEFFFQNTTKYSILGTPTSSWSVTPNWKCSITALLKFV